MEDPLIIYADQLLHVEAYYQGLGSLLPHPPLLVEESDEEAMEHVVSETDDGSLYQIGSV